MVSNRQSLLISLTLVTAAAACGAGSEPKNSDIARSPSGAVKRKFLDDDPLWKEPKPHVVTNIKTIEVDNLYDFVEQSFVIPHEQKKLKRGARSTAQNANTLGEVPDSEWYTNRHARQPMSIEQLARGADQGGPPDSAGSWRVISGKSDGVTPGFTIEDSRGSRYLLKFDPPNYPELASGADVIGSRFYYAFGYNTPENHVAYFRREQLVLSESSSYRDKSGKKRVLRAEQVNRWLAGQPRDSQGRYRVLASRWIAGKVAGPFEFEGTRSDDPNDLVAHQNRRELRGMDVFASWLNDTDAKSINTLDALVNEGGRPFMKHYRIDWGASLGSDSLEPKDVRRGHEYFVDPKPTVKHTVTFGFYLPRWMRAHYPSIRGVGRFDYASFEPLHWRTNYPVTAFLFMDDEDAFWAAKKVMSFSDAEIRAIVETAKYSDPRATDWVTECLVKRRDMVGKAWLARGLALDNFHVDQGRLVFDDLGEKYGARPKQSYTVGWSAFDNSNGEKRPVESGGNAWAIPSSAARTGFLSAAIHSAASQGGNAEVAVYLRQSASGWSVVGIDRRYE